MYDKIHYKKKRSTHKGVLGAITRLLKTVIENYEQRGWSCPLKPVVS